MLGGVVILRDAWRPLRLLTCFAISQMSACVSDLDGAQVGISLWRLDLNFDCRGIPALLVL